ncbi:uncharacterized protein LOC132548320 [Ylistrum balloti]|uniref:uncharacterized protein LOC132548320 n=1 Tax=Ylistrum balloti TaxID=509963 RepID=UPI002905A06E|nr:uncharacterized protein LOC132548320 [Ylistrum balloti]
MEENTQSETGCESGKDVKKEEKNGNIIGDFKTKLCRAFPKLHLGLKFVNCGLLIIAFAVHVHNMFSATWAIDHAQDTATSYEGDIQHQLFGFIQGGDKEVFTPHKEGYWQDWKKPLIKLEIVALSLGFAAVVIQGVIIFLHFLHPRKAEAIALLTSVILLSCGGGGLLIKTSMDYTNNRPAYGFRDTTMPPTFKTDVSEDIGRTEAIVCGAMYIIAGVIDVLLMLITSSKTSIKPEVNAN